MFRDFPIINTQNKYVIYIYETEESSNETKNGTKDLHRQIGERSLFNEVIFRKGKYGTFNEILRVVDNDLEPGDCLIIVELNSLKMTWEEYEFLTVWLTTKEILICRWNEL